MNDTELRRIGERMSKLQAELRGLCRRVACEHEHGQAIAFSLQREGGVPGDHQDASEIVEELLGQVQRHELLPPSASLEDQYRQQAPMLSDDAIHQLVHLSPQH